MDDKQISVYEFPQADKLPQISKRRWEAKRLTIKNKQHCEQHLQVKGLSIRQWIEFFLLANRSLYQILQDFFVDSHTSPQLRKHIPKQETETCGKLN